MSSSEEEWSSDEEEEELERKEIPIEEYKKLFARTSWPAKPVKDVEELKEWLDNGFCSEDDCDEGSRFFNFHDYVRKVNSLGWINALHDFYGDDDVDGEDDVRITKQTPLMYVLYSDPSDWRTVSFLLEAGADPNIRDANGKPPLFVFFEGNAWMAHWSTFQAMVEHGANVKTHFAGKSLVDHAKDSAMLNPDDSLPQMIWDEMKRIAGVCEEGSEDEYGY